MKNDENWRLYTLAEINEAFNLGLEAAIFALEKAEYLSPAGRRYLIECLRQEAEGNTKEKIHIN